MAHDFSNVSNKELRSMEMAAEMQAKFGNPDFYYAVVAERDARVADGRMVQKPVNIGGFTFYDFV